MEETSDASGCPRLMSATLAEEIAAMLRSRPDLCASILPLAGLGAPEVLLVAQEGAPRRNVLLVCRVIGEPPSHGAGRLLEDWKGPLRVAWSVEQITEVLEL